MTQTLTRSQIAAGTPATTCTARPSKQDSWRTGEIIPDSEEERRTPDKLIEISSDESDSELAIPGRWVNRTPVRANTFIASVTTPVQGSSRAARLRLHRGRRIIESSSEDDNDDEGNNNSRNDIIELFDSSPERTSPMRPLPGTLNIQSNGCVVLPDEDALYADDAILVLDEPRSARKPFRLPLHTRRSPFEEVIPDSQESAPLDGSLAVDTPAREENPALLLTPGTKTKSGTKPKSIPRMGKKAQDAAELERRESYAQDLYVELNRTVFKDKLPTDTKLNWSKRLLTTAGRAKYRRSSEGVITAEIELAQKILVSEERIRNTLAHEMCHLAAWIIDGEPKEAHGKLFYAWAKEVERKRSDIKISTKHNYEIIYPYNWECIQCAKTYGRFSKSINPKESVCGSCMGKLTPMFTTRARRAPGTPQMSRMAATTPNDSPVLASWPEVNKSNDPDADVASLTTAINSVTLVETF